MRIRKVLYGLDHIKDSGPFLEMRIPSLTFRTYLYMDTENRLIYPLYKQNKLPFVIYNNTIQMDDCNYLFHICRVFRWDAGKFENAASKMEAKMLLTGFRDYAKAWAEFKARVLQDGKWEKNGHGKQPV